MTLTLAIAVVECDAMQGRLRAQLPLHAAAGVVDAGRGRCEAKRRFRGITKNDEPYLSQTLICDLLTESATAVIKASRSLLSQSSVLVLSRFFSPAPGSR